MKLSYPAGWDKEELSHVTGSLILRFQKSLPVHDILSACNLALAALLEVPNILNVPALYYSYAKGRILNEIAKHKRNFRGGESFDVLFDAGQIDFISEAQESKEQPLIDFSLLTPLELALVYQHYWQNRSLKVIGKSWKLSSRRITKVHAGTLKKIKRFDSPSPII